MAAVATRAGKITLRLTRQFSAPRERVFAAWTTPEALKRWWCPPGWVPERIEVDLRTGGTYSLGMRESKGRSVVSIQGRFLEVRAPKRLVYTWRWNGAFEGMPETQVTVEFLSIETVQRWSCCTRISPMCGFGNDIGAGGSPPATAWNESSNSKWGYL